MSEPIIGTTEIRFGFCQVCETPARVGAIKVKGWPYTPLVCAGCWRTMATTIELDGASPVAASVAENRHE